jgi:hypothetical protein
VKKVWTLSLTLTVMFGLGAVAFFQLRAQAARPMAELVPAGPLLYLQAGDFSALVHDWNASPTKQAWLKSDNYQLFSRSRLLLRLQQAQTEFADAAGVPPDMALVDQVAGGESALALYDIGKLEFLYITRMPSARAMQSTLWQKRGDFQPRSVAGVSYYLRTDPQSGRVVCFGIAGDYLILATREDLIAGAIQLVSGQQGRTVASEGWFDQAARAAGSPGDLRLALNMPVLVKTPHFRTYWIQQNITELKQYSAAISDLRRSSAEYREERVLLRAQTPAADDATVKQSESAVAEVLRLAPDDAGVYLASANPTSAQALALVQQKILAPQSGAAPPSKEAPPQVGLGSGETGNAADLETRIDEPPVAAAAAGKLGTEPLRKLLDAAGLRAALQLESTRKLPDGVFVGSQSAIVLLATSDWDAAAVRDALSGAVESLWTTSRLGVAWSARGQGADASYQMDGLMHVSLATRGKLLILADSPEALAGVLARVSQPPAAEGAAYAAGFRHAREAENFARMTRLIDQPQMPQASGDQSGEHEPMFFSENMASLSRTLGTLQSEQITVHDRGATVTQTVVYHFAP